MRLCVEVFIQMMMSQNDRLIDLIFFPFFCCELVTSEIMQRSIADQCCWNGCFQLTGLF